MTSFAVEIEPLPQPRLAAAALLLHLAAAALPWITRCPPWLAVPLSLLAVAGLAATLARVPGRHCRLQRVSFRDDTWRVRLAGDEREEAARLGPRTRVYAGLIVLDLLTGPRRVGWLLPRPALDAAEFRRLKARLRLAC